MRITPHPRKPSAPITPALLALSVATLTGCAAPRVPHASVPLERAEAPIPASALPAPALETLRALAAGSQITSTEREDRVLYTAYEGEWLVQGVEAEATVLADGAVLEEEIELSPQQIAALPPAVLARVRELEAQGYTVQVARRVVYLFDLDASRPAVQGVPAPRREELLRPDGSSAKSPPR